MTNKTQNLECRIEESGEHDMCGVKLPLQKLVINGKEIDEADMFQTLNVNGKDKEIVVYYKGSIIDVYSPTAYSQPQCSSLPMQQRKGIGPQYRHEIIAYLSGNKKKILLSDNDDGTCPEEWHMDGMKVSGDTLLVKLRNNYHPEQSKTEEISLAKLISLEKKKKTSAINPDDAKSLIDRIGPSLGYDLTYSPEYPKTRKDVCAVKRLAENGSTYGYDTIYLVWKNKKGINHEELINSSSSKDYIHIDSIVETKDNIVVKVGSGGSYSGSAWKRSIERNKKNLGLK
jgi:hypothetical protein